MCLMELKISTSLCFVVQIVFMWNCVSAASEGCPDSYFLLCVTKLRLQRVPFDQNMLNVVFNVTSEAKLRQTCIAYTDVLPCFRDKILQCGNEKQKQLLDEVAKMIMFFCSPFSVKRQEDFLIHGSCIAKVLQMPATTDCYTEEHPTFATIEQCRKICYDKREFLCMMKIWVSEQNFCTLLDIERNCNKEAGAFYQQLQTNVFSETFPIICDYTQKNASPVLSSDSTFVDSVVDPVEFFQNAAKARGQPQVEMVPTLPSSIPVVYPQKNRPPEPPPYVLPSYLPVNPSWQTFESGPRLTPQVVEVMVTVTEQSSTQYPGSPSLWLPPFKKGTDERYPFDQPFPDSTQVGLTTPSQWRPWYLGGSPNGTQWTTTESSVQRRRLLLSDDKSTLWDSLKLSNIFEFGQHVMQNSNNNFMSRKDADASYRNSQYYSEGCTNSFTWRYFVTVGFLVFLNANIL